MNADKMTEIVDEITRALDDPMVERQKIHKIVERYFQVFDESSDWKSDLFGAVKEAFQQEISNARELIAIAVHRILEVQGKILSINDHMGWTDERED